MASGLIQSITSLFTHTTIHPYYIFCSIQNYYGQKQMEISPFTICDKFGGFLNNQCIDYFSYPQQEDCFTYIHTDENKIDIHEKWTPFIEHMIVYKRNYASFSNLLDRYEIFHDNLDYIHYHNKYSNASYLLGINPFTDLTQDEYLKLISSPKTLQKSICTKQTAQSGSLPSSIDWRNKNAVTPVKDQGQCGSCWSFSTTGAVEGIYAIKKGKLVSFSEQELVDCSYSYGNLGCNGGLMQNAFTFIHDKGLTTEDAYPYKAASSLNSCKAYTPYTYLSGCVNVIPNELQLTYAVAQQPVSVSIEADSRSFQLYKSGVYTDSACGTTLDHGVLAVGYGIDNGTPYWIVKNSWGPTWGENGYIRILRNSVATSTNGLCGIAMDASYPVL